MLCDIAHKLYPLHTFSCACCKAVHQLECGLNVTRRMVNGKICRCHCLRSDDTKDESKGDGWMKRIAFSWDEIKRCCERHTTRTAPKPKPKNECFHLSCCLAHFIRLLCTILKAKHKTIVRVAYNDTTNDVKGEQFMRLFLCFLCIRCTANIPMYILAPTCINPKHNVCIS